MNDAGAYYFKDHPWVDLLGIIVRYTPYDSRHLWKYVCKDTLELSQVYDVSSLSYPDLCDHIIVGSCLVDEFRQSVQNKNSDDKIPLDIERFKTLISTDLVEKHYLKTLGVYNCLDNTGYANTLLKIFQVIDQIDVSKIRDTQPWHHKIMFKAVSLKFEKQVLKIEKKRFGNRPVYNVVKFFVETPKLSLVYDDLLPLIDWNLLPDDRDIEKVKKIGTMKLFTRLLDLGSPPQFLLEIMRIFSIQMRDIDHLSWDYPLYRLSDQTTMELFKKYIISENVSVPFVKFLFKRTQIDKTEIIFQEDDDIEKYLLLFIQYGLENRESFYTDMMQNRYCKDNIQIHYLLLEKEPYTYLYVLKYSDSSIFKTHGVKICWRVSQLLSQKGTHHRAYYEKILKFLTKNCIVDVKSLIDDCENMADFYKRFEVVAPHLLCGIKAENLCEEKSKALQIVLHDNKSWIHLLRPCVVQNLMSVCGNSMVSWIEELIDYHTPPGKPNRVRNFIHVLLSDLISEYIIEFGTYDEYAELNPNILSLLHQVFEKYTIVIHFPHIVEYIKSRIRNSIVYRNSEDELLNEIFSSYYPIK